MTATSPAASARPVYTDIGKALGTDYFLLKADLSAEERDYLERTRRFVHEEVLPQINDFWERAEVPLDLCRRLGELGLIGDGLEGYGCPPMSSTAAGLIAMELNRGDGSVGTFCGVQGGLAMRSIHMHGSEEQKQRWLPAMARCEKLGAFALTEPGHGSDSVSLETEARRDGDEYVINGAKRWIGNGSMADVVVLWARDTEDMQVKGFLIEKGTPGYDGRPIASKGALRALWQADIDLTDVRVPAENRLPGANSFADTAKVLKATRASCAWSALGHAVAGYDAALNYATQRTQFGKPLARFQIVQEKLVRMLTEITAMQLYCQRIGELDDTDDMSDTIAALGKLNNQARGIHATSLRWRSGCRRGSGRPARSRRAGRIAGGSPPETWYGANCRPVVAERLRGRVARPRLGPVSSIPAADDVLDPAEDVYDLPHVAELLGVPVTKVQQQLREGHLVGVRRKGTVVVPRAFFDDAGHVVKSLSGLLVVLHDGGYKRHRDPALAVHAGPVTDDQTRRIGGSAGQRPTGRRATLPSGPRGGSARPGDGVLIGLLVERIPRHRGAGRGQQDVDP